MTRGIIDNVVLTKENGLYFVSWLNTSDAPRKARVYTDSAREAMTEAAAHPSVWVDESAIENQTGEDTEPPEPI